MERFPDQDRLALEQIERGDEQAIARLYDRHAGLIYSMAMRVLQNSALAEQVLSDIFIEVWRGPRRFLQIKDTFRASMAMLARNRAVALLLHMPPTETVAAFPSRPLGAGLVDTSQWNMTREEASAAVDNLPVERRRLLEKVLFHGAASSQILADSRAAQFVSRPDSTQPPLHQPVRAAERPKTVSEAVARLAGTGLEVIEIDGDQAFARRQLHVRDVVQHIEGMNRLARVFVETPERVLDQLVAAAVELCGADSAGISIEQPDGLDEHFYRWAATAGQYSGFADAKLPRYPSACGVTLERGRPQLFRVSQRFFDLMGVQAPTVTDGLLLPWQVDDTRGTITRGTIWIMAHGRQEAFDSEDCRMMQALASFAATGVRMMQQQNLLMEQAKAAAEAAMAQKIARQIDTPLQGLMQSVVLLGRGGQDSSLFAQQAMGDLARLSDLVNRNLSLPN
jgi:DNA-directed RNA polymerase specialized sigma24 family protein